MQTPNTPGLQVSRAAVPGLPSVPPTATPHRCRGLRALCPSPARSPESHRSTSQLAQTTAGPEESCGFPTQETALAHSSVSGSTQVYCLFVTSNSESQLLCSLISTSFPPLTPIGLIQRHQFPSRRPFQEYPQGLAPNSPSRKLLLAHLSKGKMTHCLPLLLSVNSEHLTLSLS